MPAERQDAMNVVVHSFCTISHIEVWKRTAAMLPECIQASAFKVFVPQADVEEFRRVTPSGVHVLPEDELIEPFRQELQERCAEANNSIRSGWYLQQFLKLESVFQSASEITVIWDADCVPLSQIKVLDSASRVAFMKGKEQHLPYFEQVERLLQIPRVADFSFIVPAFPIRREWASDLKLEIETKHAQPWHKALMDTVDFSLPSGLSEYELMGTWISNTYPNSYSTYDLRWERLGTTRFGPVEYFTASDLRSIGRIADLEVASFENWDEEKGLRWRARRLRDRLAFGAEQRLLH